MYKRNLIVLFQRAGFLMGFSTFTNVVLITLPHGSHGLIDIGKIETHLIMRYWLSSLKKLERMQQ